MNCIINLNTSSRYCSTAAPQHCRSAGYKCGHSQHWTRVIITRMLVVTSLMMAGGVETRSSATALRNPRSDLSLFLRPGMETKGVNEISRYVKGFKDFLLKKPPVNDDIFSPNFRWRDS